MRSTKNDLPESQGYPYLGVFEDGTVILFTAAEEGTVVHVGDGSDSIGDHSNDWAEEDVKRFTGKITLEN